VHCRVHEASRGARAPRTLAARAASHAADVRLQAGPQGRANTVRERKEVIDSGEEEGCEEEGHEEEGCEEEEV